MPTAAATLPSPSRPQAPRPAELRRGLLEPRPPLPPRQRRFKAGTTGFMLALHVGAVAALLPRFWSLPAVLTLAVLYWVTVLGVTLGLHRLVAHRSFSAPRWLERLLVLMGTLACQSGPIEWVGLHRHHHLHSDQVNDHHDARRGLWWSHSAWMLHEIPALREVSRFTGDLRRDPFYRWLDRWFLLLQIPLGLTLYALGERLAVPGGGLALVLWGIPLRLVLVYHVTWLVNSATHAFGYRNFDSPDLSRNCWWVALLSFGEGWHNNHHAHPSSARHGLRWFELDITWAHIRVLRALGLARRLRLAPMPGSGR
ncbi:fatty acid desaturase [Synechococcus sp. RSCCF101]|uniref:acyl-CoA desaturase n=1 Tax=Synechococcus sp. RSCCF101 TaxID=2511069 RepID=UPI001CD9B19C|nr:fatty acid desaturase [Synechococcus sp. RSCCF101]